MARFPNGFGSRSVASPPPNPTPRPPNTDARLPGMYRWSVAWMPPARREATSRIRGRTHACCIAWLVVWALASPAHAAPVASLREDIDGDSAPDTIELTGDGVLHVGGKRRADVAIASGATQAKIAIARGGDTQ